LFISPSLTLSNHPNCFSSQTSASVDSFKPGFCFRPVHYYVIIGQGEEKSDKQVLELISLRLRSLRSDQIWVNQIECNQAGANKIRSVQIRSDQFKRNQISSNMIRSVQIWSDQFRCDQIGSDMIRSVQIWSEKFK